MKGSHIVKDNRKSLVKSKREVIVSAGVINSPQLLMLSGIGPKDQLQKHKVCSFLMLGSRVVDQETVILHYFDKTRLKSSNQVTVK